MVTYNILWVLLAISKLGSSIDLQKLSSKHDLALETIVNPITDINFKRDLHFIVMVSINSTQPELIRKVLAHINQNMSVPILTLDNFTGRSTFNYEEHDEEDNSDEDVYEEYDTKVADADTDYEEDSYDFENHDFLALKRSDTIENSVGFIFFVREVTDHCFVDSDFTSSPFWNSRAFILLVITEPVGQEPETIVKMFQDCWDKHSILNLAVVCVSDKPKHQNFKMMYSEKTRAAFHIMSYNPFISYNTFHSLQIYKNSTLVPSTLFSSKTINVRGYPINVKETIIHPLLFEKNNSDGQVYFEGPDGYILNSLLKKMNAYINFVHFNGENPFLVKSESSKNILASSIPTVNKVLNNFAYPHEEICITAIVPKSLPMPKYMNFILPFSVNMWTAFILINFVLILVWIWLSRYKGFNEGIPFHARDIVLELFRLMMLQGTKYQPVFFVQRFFICLFLVHFLITNYAYQGAMTSYLTVQQFYPEINTLREVLDTELKAALFLTEDDIMSLSTEVDLEDEFLKRLLPRFVLIPNETEALEMVAVHRNIIKPVDLFMGRMDMEKPYFYKDGYPLLHIVDECYVHIPLGFMTVSKNNPFLSRFNDLIVRLSQGGLISKWRSDYVLDSAMFSRKIKNEDEPMVITLNHLEAPFMLLFFGIFISTATFIFEWATIFIKPTTNN